MRGIIFFHESSIRVSNFSLILLVTLLCNASTTLFPPVETPGIQPLFLKG